MSKFLVFYRLQHSFLAQNTYFILDFSGHLFIKINPDVNANVIGVIFQAIREMEAKTLIRFKMHSKYYIIDSVFKS